MDRKPRIAHLTGPNATIQNTPPLVTSNKARAKHNLQLSVLASVRIFCAQPPRSPYKAVPRDRSWGNRNLAIRPYPKHEDWWYLGSGRVCGQYQRNY